ncbi:carboxylesterase/lipase family protein [Nocardioides sp.]|uniref:carboxylesterase/lipase family protein n=1 Tax=Nocardioides sp. TaxID=35761 RepID=UPI0039E25675
MDEVLVRTSDGLLRGSGVGSVARFAGIPYAAPPIGPLRWRPPAPVEPWEGERPAQRFAPAPLQGQPPRDNIMWHANFADSHALVMSEDCLYLNVWTPDPGGSGLPVLVFLQGGGNRFGHGGQEVHDGAALARRGIVVVTLSVRLGILGFLAHPELAAEDELGACGNYGVLDALAALEWVQQHIVAFGGDPAKVTFGGNSAGAVVVTHLMASHLGRGLFRAAIGQSAAGVYRAEGALPSHTEAQEHGLAALGPLAKAPLARLRRLSGASFLLDAHLGVVVDGRVVTEQTDAVFERGGQVSVPLLAGWNTDEGANFTPAAALPALRSRILEGPHGAVLAEHYPVDDARLQASARAFTGDAKFAGPVLAWARTHVATSEAPTWVYEFDQAPPLPAGLDLVPPADGGAGYGVFHTAELPYISDNLDCRPWDWRECDRELAGSTADAWARFVADLDPNGPGLPQWPAFDGGRDGMAMRLNEQPGAAPIRRAAALAVLAGLPRPL